MSNRDEWDAQRDAKKPKTMKTEWFHYPVEGYSLREDTDFWKVRIHDLFDADGAPLNLDILGTRLTADGWLPSGPSDPADAARTFRGERTVVVHSAGNFD